MDFFSPRAGLVHHHRQDSKTLVQVQDRPDQAARRAQAGTCRPPCPEDRRWCFVQAHQDVRKLLCVFQIQQGGGRQKQKYKGTNIALQPRCSQVRRPCLDRHQRYPASAATHFLQGQEVPAPRSPRQGYPCHQETVDQARVDKEDSEGAEEGDPLSQEEVRYQGGPFLRFFVFLERGREGRFEG